MSLNKFNDLQLGRDLGLQIGCEELSANIATIGNATVGDATIANAYMNVVDAVTLSASILNVGGVPFDPVGTSNLQSVGLSTKDVGGVATETDLFPAVYLGALDGEFPANSLQIGDVIKIDSFLKVVSAATGILNVALYAGDGVSSVIAETDGFDASPFSVLSVARLEISINIRDTTVCHIDGILTIYDEVSKSSRTHPIRQKQTLLDITAANKLRLTGRWISGHVGSNLSQRQLTFTKHSVAQIV